VKPGELVSGKYRLLFRIGLGGMAEVWAATNLLTHRDFAIKLILPELAGREEAVERFLQEAKTAGRLRHPNIVDVFDVGTSADGRPFLVMELLRGESLESRLAREEYLDPLTACVVGAGVARGLGLAHRAGVVHRDLSSANLFLAHGADGSGLIPKILDFGVSKILRPGLDGKVRTGDGAILGSPAFMSPEQARGAEQVDARSDLWSVGVVLYEALSVRSPFVAANYNALMVAILGDSHVPLGEIRPRLDRDLVRAVERCLIKDREQRTGDALELARELERIARKLSRDASECGPRRRATDRFQLGEPESGRPRLAGLPAQAFPLGVRCWRFVTRRSPPGGLVAGGVLGGTALGLFLGVAVAGTVAAPPPPPRLTPPATLAPAARVSTAPAARGAKAPAETDLVRATAVGLGLERHGDRARALAVRSRARRDSD
jgi:eukaryotic-like serine/threonine-protein kinase